MERPIPPARQAKPVPMFHHVYLRLLCNVMRARGYDTGALLAAAGLKPADIGLEGKHIAPARMAVFLRTVRQQCPDPLLPLEWASMAAANHAHGMLGAAIQTSADLREALQTICAFSPLRATIFHFHLAEDGGEACLEIGLEPALADLHDFLYLAMAVLLARIAGTLIGEASRRLRQEFPFVQPDWGEAAAAFFQYPIAYGAPVCRLRIPAALLAEPCETADRAAHQAAVRQCRFDAESRAGDVSMKVIALLADSDGAYPSLVAAARRLGASPRSLSRALNGEGSSYKDLIDEVKKLHAQSLLHDPNWTIDQVAERLGYAETSNFIRAFRRWAGCTPQQFRARGGKAG
ncbi:AraC family transcriptional regulator [Duganella sp. LX20W]|uniref:AraC family transcriptional regulator n=1 Tax=Rugamonas brunnea TaxID=2758569 RepID=A0A7W2EQS3_9BURK|nr:AraC family transcriptional regulator [Rugamonas brunnea]MBA5636873.1 AraC family transcriptional regulator [Rugamonas brunnea]